MNEYSALAIVHAVNTTKREIVHAYRKVRSATSEVVDDHATYQKYPPSRVSRCYQRNVCTINEAPRKFGEVDDVLRPVIVNTNTV